MSQQEVIIATFIDRWERSAAAERANYQMFLSELCALLEVAPPNPTTADPEKNLYVFDRAITRTNPDGTAVTNYIDLYKAGHFVCETKQGSSEIIAEEDAAKPSSTKLGHGKRGSAAFDKALERAYNQGRDYITSLPANHGRPPFLIVCDVGYSIDLYAEFTCTGGRYERFPDPKNHRILLADLHRPEIRERLRAVFTDPHSLDPSKKAAEVTRDIADRLAKLAKSLEAAGHDPQVIAGFLQRSLFTMFAEDIGLLPENGFKDILEKVKDSPHGFVPLVTALWKEMATGTSYSTLLMKEIAHFNGGLFENTTALPLNHGQLSMLIDAAGTDWSGVEPSIFGTLLTRALDSRERHKLGAEYTPRSYVERLIRPTIIEPLRDEWESVRIAAAKLHADAEILEVQADLRQQEMNALGTTKEAQAIGAERNKLLADAKKKDAEALKLVTAFHRHLCGIKVLDPACGTANFLYVTLEHMKRLEAEVLELVTALGGDATFEMNEYKVRPEQFLGLELSHNAVAIAQLVLWIGYFQWQRKTTGKADTGDRPLLPKTQSIRQQDAVLAYDEKIPRIDEETGKILTIWDGHSTKPHPVTGKEVPDESARTVLFDYINPRRAEWPQADYIVGNPPFIGKLKMRESLGDGYTEALRIAWKGDVPDSADLVMYWWRNAADMVASGKTKRFGFITTNSIYQTFNRRVLEDVLNNLDKPIYITYAIPDHPWIDSADAAAVRIAMTVAAPGKGEGIRAEVVEEKPGSNGECTVLLKEAIGIVAANLQVGADLSSSVGLIANTRVSSTGLILGGRGFVISSDEATHFCDSSNAASSMIFPLWSGKDIAESPRANFVIDTNGMTEEDLQSKAPAIWQHLKDTVFPERATNRDPKLSKYWWLFRRANTEVRGAIAGLSKFIITPETAKYRLFVMVNKGTMPEHGIIAIGIDSYFIHGILSSSIHELWALRSGGLLGPTPRYNKTRCFETFPLPALEEGELQQRIRELGERLDSHRKRQLEQHPSLTMTGMYNVLEKLRSGETLTEKDKVIHDQGLVTLLKQLHDELDAAVLEAYGWSDLAIQTQDIQTQDIRKEEFEQELLTRLVALNHQRAAEEKQGLIRWLRPEYQNPKAGESIQPTLTGTETETTPKNKKPKAQAATPAATLVWSDTLTGQVAQVRQLLSTNPTATAETLSQHFGRKNQKRTDQIASIIEMLKGLGQV